MRLILIYSRLVGLSPRKSSCRMSPFNRLFFHFQPTQQYSCKSPNSKSSKPKLPKSSPPQKSQESNSSNLKPIKSPPKTSEPSIDPPPERPKFKWRKPLTKERVSEFGYTLAGDLILAMLLGWAMYESQSEKRENEAEKNRLNEGWQKRMERIKQRSIQVLETMAENEVTAQKSWMEEIFGNNEVQVVDRTSNLQ